jgi:outer membrane protein TolC
MSLDDCIALTLRENRTIKNAYLDRVVQKYDLRMAEDKFIPTLTLAPSVTGSGNTPPPGRRYKQQQQQQHAQARCGCDTD